MKFQIVIFLLMHFTLKMVNAQEVYNNCNAALELCPNSVFTVNNLNSNVTFCPGCEDDFSDCFTFENTIWLTFTTNSSGGDISANFSNLIFEANPGQGSTINAQILQAPVACDASTYSPIGNCVSSVNGSFSLFATSLPANTTYYIVISGGLGTSSPAECTFDIEISGPGVDQSPSSIAINTPTTSICLYDQVTFTASLTNCPEQDEYSWFVNGLLVALTSDPIFQTTLIQDGDIVSVSNSCYSLCPITVSDQTVPFNVYSFLVDAGSDIYSSSGETVQLAGNTSAPVFQWYPSASVSDPFSLTPFVTPFQTTTYTLSANENGCTLSDEITVNLDESLEIPNTFSPNEDGNNDTWVIRGIENYPNNQIKIFNRWGQEVFSTSGYSKEKAWNGTIRNGKASEGVYYYVIQLRDDEKQEFNGYLNLIR